MSSRREFLKFLAMGAAGMQLDPEFLVWQPGAKKIFLIDIPKGVSASEIIALEMKRIVPKIRDLFERDDLFYAAIRTGKTDIVSERLMRVPLRIEE